MPDLFDRGDLASWLQLPSVDNSTADRAIRASQGWLMRATGIAAWPSPAPDDLWAWAVELGGIAYNNPTALNSEQIDDYSMQYGDRMRRKEILDAARSAYNTSTRPQYSFPDPDWHWDVSSTSILSL